VIECGLAAKPPEKKIDITGPEAALGLATHDSLEPWVEAGMVDQPTAQPYANSRGVDPKKVEALIEVAPTALKEIREDLSNPRAEVAVEGGGIRGRIDVLFMRMAGAKLFSIGEIDWKTGRDPQAGTKPGQRLAYASAIEDRYGMPANGYIYCAEVWLGSGDIIESRFDIDTINGFRARLAERLKYQSASPGACCKWCDRRYECAEREQYIRGAVSSLTQFDAGADLVEQAGALWEQSRAVKRAIEHYERVVDALIDEQSELPLPDGRKLVHASKTLDHIEPQKAWPVMRSHGLSNDDLGEIVKVSKTGLLRTVSDRAPKGKKAEAKKAIMTALDLAGAISRTTSWYKRITN
jgi:hypothetical protein